MYHKKHKYDIIIVLAVIALAVSLFLAVSSALEINVPCNLTGGCEAVLNSKYSRLFNYPLAYWGVAYFGIVVVIALLSNHYQRSRRTLTWFLGLGALVSLSLLSIQFFVLKSVCQYCLAVDFLVFAMFLWDLNIEHIGFRV